MTATSAQVRIALNERAKGRTQTQAAAKAGLQDRGTVARYERGAKPPWEAKPPRDYRTRPDPFEADWPKVEGMLEAAPGLEAKALFKWLCEQSPGRYQEGQLRTFQRRVGDWRALNAPADVELPQVREPGAVMQTDGTCMNKLGITLGGEVFKHVLIHSVLPYSNWEWGTVAQSESLMAVTHGFQTAVAKLGYLPKVHQTDSSTAATHTLGAKDEDATVGESGRAYNRDYLAVLAHHGVTPRTTHLNSPDENGDSEALHGGLKREIEQHLLLRGSRDFEDYAAYEAFLEDLLRRRNHPRQNRIEAEVAVMRPVSKPPLSTRREFRPRVTRRGTVRILNNTYSVPSGLKGRTVIALIDEWTIEIHYARRLVQRMQRLMGEGHADIQYRHVLPTLLKKPGGFRHYCYRDQLFPSAVFRSAWEDLDARLSPRRADLTYLRILKLAADGFECDVHDALELVLEAGGEWDDTTIADLVQPRPMNPAPAMERPEVDLLAYDTLLSRTEVTCELA